jgi:chromosome segregation ATPase
MNNDRRKQIEALRTRLEQILADIEEVRIDLTSIENDEQEYFDNMPESLQAADKGDKASAAIDALASAASDLEDITFDDVYSYLDTAAE